MTEALRYDGKVAVITGAGNGLGRAHALMFGVRGAKVVVNDLGGGRHGGGQSSAAADKVVDEIRSLGGIAVANYDSVEDGGSIVQTALDAYGTLDIVINNAGILRDVSFQKMTLDDWNLILKVHLQGSFSVTHAAWPILREKAYGRVIFTTSGAGIYGNFGQANYTAAKMGIWGLANTLALEGHAKNILVNTIAPIAGSRLTETIMPPELIAALKPEYVSPLVGWLCHESCADTGGLFEVGAGYVSKLRWERTLGHCFNTQQSTTPEAIAAKWKKITDFEGAEHPTSINDTFGVITQAINRKTLGGNDFIDLDIASAAVSTAESAYGERDLSLYALSVGAAADPLDASELAFVYENHECFAALPTWAVMDVSKQLVQQLTAGNGGLPGLNYGFDRVLHGGQYTEIRAPLPRAAKIKHTFKLKAAYDKNPHAVVVIAISSHDELGVEIAYNEFTTFVRGAGGWGGDRGPSGDTDAPPSREPDTVIEEKTDANQALLYRLCGDINPLHADPEFAKNFGYERPILQGLCTYGHVGRHVIKAFCDNDPRRFRSIRVRFAETVFPGETLVTRLWRESATRIVFETRVKERDELVIRNAAAELYEQPLLFPLPPVECGP
jgi:NAD(P)-dependent dehydrogenase (short-subunit alcohol dehydrogenase family)/acyl dehydratase